MSDPFSPDVAKLAVDAADSAFKNTTVYEDALQPVAKEIGKTLGIIGKTVNIALTPVSAMIWGYDKISNYLSSSLEKKFTAKNIPPENIISPDPLIAGPLINNFRFLGNKESLRDMYTNLLATSMNKETASIAHPCFVEIIKQLSSDEAKIMKLDIKHHVLNQCIVSIIATREGSLGIHTVRQHVSYVPRDAGCEYPDSFPTYVANLTRLGLLSFTYEKYLTYKSCYEAIEQMPLVKNYFAAINSSERYQSENYKPGIQKGMLQLTPLGEQFQKACIG
jgi:hypothetical protein